MAGIVRTSKFRHVFGSTHKSDNCYHNVKVTKDSADSNFCAVNPKFLAAVVVGAGGGPFIVIPLDQVGRLPPEQPKVNGHGQKVLDLAWAPFNDNVLASCSEDCSIKIWEIPDGGIDKDQTEPYLTLSGHERKVTIVVWHPTADNILLSAGADNKIMVWNVEAGEAVFELRLPDVPQSLSWNQDGSLIAVTSKDKKLRIIDIREEQIVKEVDCFDGSKPSKCVFLSDGRVFATGFSRMSKRLLALFDKDLNKIHTVEVDSASGTVYPFYDPDTSVVFTVGKGDTAIKYYEINDDKPYVHYLSTFSSTKSQRGVGWMPKRGCDVRSCEIARFYKLVLQDNSCEVVSMTVPRKSELFQDDLYPPFCSDEPALSAAEWIAGQNAPPRKASWQDVFNQSQPVQTVKKSNKPQRALSKVTRPSAKSAGPAAVQNGASLPAGLNIEELVDDVKKLKATVRKQGKRISQLEQMIGDAVEDGQCDDAEEE